MADNRGARSIAWLVGRIAVLVIGVWGIASFSASETNVSVISGIGIAVICAAALLLWFVAKSRHMVSGDQKTPFSFTEPFYPMQSYPLRFWFLTSVVAVLGGIASTVRALNGEPRLLGFGLLFGLFGLFATLVVFGVYRWGR